MPLTQPHNEMTDSSDPITCGPERYDCSTKDAFYYITVPVIQIAQTQRLNPNNVHINKDYQPMFNK